MPTGQQKRVLPRPKSQVNDPVLILGKKTNKRGMLGPILFLGFIGSLAGTVVWFSIRPKNESLEHRANAAAAVVGDALDDLRGEAPLPDEPKVVPPAAAPAPVKPAEPTVESMTEHGVLACYAAAGEVPPHRLAVDVANVSGKLKVKRPKILGKVRNCVVSIIETVQPPAALAQAATLRYAFGDPTEM